MLNTLVIMVVVVALLLALMHFLPLDAKGRSIVYLLIVVVIVVWLLQSLGVL